MPFRVSSRNFSITLKWSTTRDKGDDTCAPEDLRIPVRHSVHESNKGKVSTLLTPGLSNTHNGSPCVDRYSVPPLKAPGPKKWWHGKTASDTTRTSGSEGSEEGRTRSSVPPKGLNPHHLCSFLRVPLRPTRDPRVRPTPETIVRPERDGEVPSPPTTSRRDPPRGLLVSLDLPVCPRHPCTSSQRPDCRTTGHPMSRLVRSDLPRVESTRPPFHPYGRTGSNLTILSS